MKDISVCIAHRGDALGLWATLQSCEIELKAAGLNFEFCIFSNGEKESVDTKQIIRMTKHWECLGYYEHSDEAFTPQMARQKAIENSQGKHLFLVDNHVVLCRDFFKRAIIDFEKYGIDILHSCTRYYMNDSVCYGYKLQLHTDFWGRSEGFPEHEYKPFKIAAAGHGGLIVKRDVFDKLGGYYLSSSFAGYGGEELTFDLGAWMQGMEVWIDPQIEHRHFAAATRGYQRHFSENFYKNLFSCACILAGDTVEDYVYDMLKHFKKSSKPFLQKDLYDILTEAQERSKPYIAWFNARKIRTLEEQLHYFLTNGIAYR